MKKKNKIPHPPLLFEWIFKRFFPDNGEHTPAGDLREVYTHIAQQEGRMRAGLWYRKEAAKAILHYFDQLTYNGVDMLKNYLLIGMRNIMKHKLFSAINISGFAIALASVVLIYLYIQDELSYDEFHYKKERLYRVTVDYYNKDGSIDYSHYSVPPFAGPHLKEYLNEVDTFTRVKNRGTVFRINNELFRGSVTFADNSFFRCFSFPLKSGSSENALAKLNSVVLSSKTAEKFFPDKMPLGQEIELQYNGQKKVFTVTGVTEPIPDNSTIQFEALINFENLRQFGSSSYSNKMSFSSSIFMLLKEETEPEFVRSRLGEFTDKYFSDIYSEYGHRKNTGELRPFSFNVQSISDIRFDNSVIGAENLSAIYILTLIALIILIIAAVNFVNISMARSSLRFQEIGMRKIAGADRGQIFRQFMSESFMITLASAGAAFFIAALLLPEFNDMTGKKLSLESIGELGNLTIILTAVLFSGIASGVYPALVLSGFKPKHLFSKKMSIGSEGFFSRAMIVFQFTISIFLLAATFIMSEQINYMLSKDKGLESEGVISIYLQNYYSSDDIHINSLKNKLLRSPSIEYASLSTADFTGRTSDETYVETANTKKVVRHINADAELLETMELKLKEGRNFEANRVSDTASVIINESFTETFGLKDPIDEVLEIWNNRFKVIGVVKDFHVESMKSEIRPVIFFNIPSNAYCYLHLKIKQAGIVETIKYITNIWKDFQPEKPLEYSFLQEELASLYSREKRWKNIILYSSIFATLIACLGIFGLTSISISRKIKEIGIRKVLGAGVSDIIILTMKKYILLVLTANLIAFPVIYLTMQKYLSNFAYRIDLSYEFFLLALLISLMITIMTIISISLKAAYMNPIKTLKTD